MNTQFIPILIFIPLLALSFYFGYTPLLVPVVFLSVSLIAFAIYYADKSAAIAGSWRTPENTLHILALLCGWPGALIAQQTLRHKTKKKNFRIVFWLTVLINTGVFIWLHTVEGNRALHTGVKTIDTGRPYLTDSYTVSNFIHRLIEFQDR